VRINLAWLRWALPLAIALTVLPIPVVSVLEERDSFCIACHTAPEVAYYNRAQSALAGAEPIADLSSVHYTSVAAGGQAFRCIDCHRGDGGLAHRAATLALGARDALIFVTGQANQTIEKAQIEAPDLLTAGCVKCHAVSLLLVGFENHFHNKLPEAYTTWQAGGQLVAPTGQPGADTTALERYATSVRCLDCHRAHHQTPGGELTGYLDLENDTLPACVRCHQETGGGPLELIAP
jgi:hypothetical protein